MTIIERKYNWHKVLTDTITTYSPGNRNLIEVFIKIKDTQSEWFRLRYANDKPAMWRGPRHGLSLREQKGPELETEKYNLGKVEVNKVGEPLRFFQNYDSFWERINK